jgi:integrase
MSSRKGRRGHGEGSVYRRPDGHWAGMLDLGWIDGKRRRRTVSGRTRAEVVDKLDELRRQKKRGTDLAARPRTVEQWMNEWVNEIKAHDGTHGSTLARYGQVSRVHIVPSLGRKRLDRLTPAEVQSFVNRLANKVAASSVVKIHGVLRAALSDAERLDLVPRNVAKSVRPPRLGRVERPTLTPTEAKKLLHEVEGHRHEGVVVIALALGMRRGEILGLRWEDVDLEERTIRIRRALQRVNGELVMVEPKTHRSRRALPLPAMVVPALERQRERQEADHAAAGPAWQDHGLIFASAIGTPMEPRNVHHWFCDVRTRLGLEWLRFHDLRHACATFLLAHGVDPRTVMDVLGHSTIRLTMDTYSHVLPERMHNAASVMDDVLGEDGPGPDDESEA